MHVLCIYGVLPHTCQTGLLSFIKAKPFSFFLDQVVFCYQTRHQTPLWQPFTLQFKVPRWLFSIYTFIEASPSSVPVSARVWQRALSVLDVPRSPQALVLLLSAKWRGQIACNRPAISFSSSVSTLDPTARSKEGYHSPIKKVNLPSPAPHPHHSLLCLH